MRFLQPGPASRYGATRVIVAGIALAPHVLLGRPALTRPIRR